MNPLRRPRLWVRLISVVALIVAAWLLLVPRTASYWVDAEGHPYDLTVLYSWGTSDQTLVVPKSLFDANADGRVGPYGPGDLVTGVRLSCGTAFTSGKNEDKHRGDGAEACSAVEAPRRIIGLCLAALGVVGLSGASRLPRLRVPMEP